MTTYTVTSPFTGKVHTRNSKKSHYTHAVVVAVPRYTEGLWEEVSFVGSLANAQKRLAELRRNWPNNVGGHIAEAAV